MRVLGIIRFILELPEIKCGFAKEIDFIMLKHIHRFCGRERRIDPCVNEFWDLEMLSVTESFFKKEHVLKYKK